MDGETRKKIINEILELLNNLNSNEIFSILSAINITVKKDSKFELKKED